MPKITYICPYCFEEHKINHVQFRCRNKQCKTEKDLEYAKYSRTSPVNRQICFNPKKTMGLMMPEREKCHECGELSSTRESLSRKLERLQNNNEGLKQVKLELQKENGSLKKLLEEEKEKKAKEEADSPGGPEDRA